MSRARLFALALAFALHAPARAQGVEDAASHAFVELVAEPASPYVGQPLRVTLRFGFTAGFLKDHVVPLFAQKLEVPVQLELPWLDAPEGVKAREADAADAGEPPLRCALNGGVAALRRRPNERRDGRDFELFELVRAVLPERAGTLSIAEPSLRFAWASQFDDDLLRGRVARDRKVEVVRGRPLELEVAALPSEGRPQGFGGAVGTLTLRAELAAPAPRPDGTLRLVVTIEGEGNLEAFDAPSLPELAPFHRVGTLEERSTSRRRLLCDLKPRSAATRAVPPLSFAFFDPTPPAGYRVVHTDPIAIEGVAGAETAARPPPPTNPADGAAAASDRRGVAPIVAIAFAGLLAVAVLLVLRRRARGSADPADTRASSAAATFAERARAPGADLAEALADYLAARLATTPAAVISPELPARLRERSIAPELAARSAEMLKALVAARYGAGRPAPTQEVPQLVLELEAAFAAAADRSAGASRR